MTKILKFVRVLGAKFEEPLLRILCEEFQVVGEVHSELEAFDPFYFGPVDGGVLSLLSPVVHNQHLRFVDVDR